MWIFEILKNISPIEALMFGSAGIFFSTLAVFAGIVDRSLILLVVYITLGILALIFWDDLYFQWMLWRSS